MHSTKRQVFKTISKTVGNSALILSPIHLMISTKLKQVKQKFFWIGHYNKIQSEGTLISYMLRSDGEKIFSLGCLLLNRYFSIREKNCKNRKFITCSRLESALKGLGQCWCCVERQRAPGKNAHCAEYQVVGSDRWTMDCLFILQFFDIIL